MAHILAKIRGVNIDDIKKALDADAWKHFREGLKVEHLWQNADDADEVQFLFSADDLEHAKKFIGERHAEAKAKDPNANLPQMIFLDEKEGWDFDIEFEEGDKKEEEEKKDESKKTEGGQAPSLVKNFSLLAGGLAVGITVGVSFGNTDAQICEIPEVVEQQQAVTPAPATPLSTGASQIKSPASATKTETAVPAPAESMPDSTGDMPAGSAGTETIPEEKPAEDPSSAGQM